MKLSALCEAANIFCPAYEAEREITQIVTDSKSVRAGSLFVCIKGLHTDSHRFIGDAVLAGAACILTEEGADYEVFPNVVYLSSPSTRSALSLLYHAWYGFPTRHLKVIGVTGTNGKTTVTHMLRAILEAAFYRCGLSGTVGCESLGRHLESSSENPLANMTTPDPAELYRIFAEMVRDGVEYVLMEVTSHALALGKLEPINFEAAIFTNLTPDHLDFHKTMDAYAEAKAKLFGKSKCSFINLDSPFAGRMIIASNRYITCSTKGKTADYVVENAEVREASGVAYDLCSKRAHIRMSCPIPGAFTVSNSLQAAACALELGISPSLVKDALSNLCGIKGRMEKIKLGFDADFSVLIDYAHTPDALENLLRTAKDLKQSNGRIVLLFGCGGDRDAAKRAVMGKIASSFADFVIVTSDNSRSEDPQGIITQILSGMDPTKPYKVIPNRAEAIAWAVQTAKAGDLILLAGKGHEEYEITREGRRPFFEKQIVQAAFADRLRSQKTKDATETEL